MPADLPPPRSKKPAASHKFSDDAPTRESPLQRDPQDAVDPDEAVTQIAPSSRRK